MDTFAAIDEFNASHKFGLMPAGWREELETWPGDRAVTTILQSLRRIKAKAPVKQTGADAGAVFAGLQRLRAAIDGAVELSLAEVAALVSASVDVFNATRSESPSEWIEASYRFEAATLFTVKPGVGVRQAVDGALAVLGYIKFVSVLFSFFLGALGMLSFLSNVNLSVIAPAQLVGIVPINLSALANALADNAPRGFDEAVTLTDLILGFDRRVPTMVMSYVEHQQGWLEWAYDTLGRTVGYAIGENIGLDPATIAVLLAINFFLSAVLQFVPMRIPFRD